MPWDIKVTWIEFFNNIPWLDTRLEIQHAHLCKVIADCHSTQKSDIDDFRIDFARINSQWDEITPEKWSQFAKERKEISDLLHGKP